MYFFNEKRGRQNKEVSAYYQEFLDSQDAWHSNVHIQRVVAFAEEINKYERKDEIVVNIGAMLHQFHDPNLDKLKILLDKSGLQQDIKDHLYEVVEACRPDKISHLSSPEARIVFDADALDLMGPSGFLREFSCNIQVRGYDMEFAVNKALDVQDLFRSKLQTTRARIIADQMTNVTKDFVDAFRRNEEWLVQINGVKY